MGVGVGGVEIIKIEILLRTIVSRLIKTDGMITLSEHNIIYFIVFTGEDITEEEDDNDDEDDSSHV